MRCFFCNNLNTAYAELSNSESKHIFSVLRAKPNTKVLLIDGKGNSAEAVVQSNKSIKIEKLNKHSEPDIKIHLYVAPPRKQKMDLLLSQCTEAGVWSIQPILTENSVAIPQKDNTTEKWRTKLIEACKQAHNPYLPIISPCIPLTKAVQNIVDTGTKAFYGSTDFTKSTFQKSNDKHIASDIAWFVGPEGGFSPSELAYMKNAGFQGLSIGNWVMRVETAALAGIVTLQQLAN